jgi:YesN/AraC family two-component response regulator
MKELPRHECGTCKKVYHKKIVKESVSGLYYCSRACYLDSMRDVRKCVQCRRKFKIKKSKPNKLCSRECSIAYIAKKQRKISDKQADVIRKKFAEGYTRKQLADHYEVNPWTITRIVNHKR